MATVVLTLRVPRWRVLLCMALVRVISPFVWSERAAALIADRMAGFVVRGIKTNIKDAPSVDG